MQTTLPETTTTDRLTDGLHRKYDVSRVDGRDKPGGDRAGARYFVLDIVHDTDARATIYKYATLINNDKLAAEIIDWLKATEKEAFDFRIKQGPIKYDYADECHILKELAEAEKRHEIAYSNESDSYYLRRNAVPA